MPSRDVNAAMRLAEANWKLILVIRSVSDVLRA